MRRKHLQFLLEQFEMIPSEDYSTQLRKALSICFLLGDKQAVQQLQMIQEGYSSIVEIPLRVLDYLVNPSKNSVNTNFNKRIAEIPTSSRKRKSLTILQIDSFLFDLSIEINKILVLAISKESFVGSNNFIIDDNVDYSEMESELFGTN